MSNYTKSTDFASKDSLASGNAAKIVKGTEIDTEFNNIATAIATKADLASPGFSGSPTAPTASSGDSSTKLATTAFVTGAVATAASNALSDPGANGMVVRTASSTTTARTITASTGITVSNGTGVSGNPTIAVTAAGISSTELGSSSVIAAKIATSAVETAKIADANVTAAKLSGAQSGSAPIYGARAWVTFDGTKDTSGATSTSNTNRLINGSGNVSSVARNGTGDYTVNLTTAVADANFAAVFTSNDPNTSVNGPLTINIVSQTSSSVNIRAVQASNNSASDTEIISGIFLR